MSCGYCNNTTLDSLLVCLACDRRFCSSTDCSKHSHVLCHIKESGHRKFMTTEMWPVKCDYCNETNVYELGGYEDYGEMHFRCRSGCADNKMTEADLLLWKPLVVADVMQPWLLAPTSFCNPHMFFDAIPKLEKLWKKNPKTTLRDIQQFNHHKKPIKNNPIASSANLPPGFQSGEEYFTFFTKLIEKERLTALEDERRNMINVAACYWDPAFPKQAELVLQVNNKHVSPRLEVQLIRHEWSAIGNIVWIKPGRLSRIRVSFENDKKQNVFPSSVTVGYELKIDAWSEVTFERMNSALESLRATVQLSWLGAALFRGDVSVKPLQCAVPAQFVATPPGFAPSLRAPALAPTPDKNLALNASQQQAISMAMRESVCLIQGPPGTGKSSIAVELVKAVAHEGKILVCAPSNVVTDHLAKILAKMADLDVVRVVARSREESSTDLAIALHNLCKEESSAYTSARIQLRNLEKGNDDPEEIRRLTKICLQIENERLNKADVIVTTCIGAGDGRVVNRRFQTVIIDEATQTVEPACLVPAVLSTHRVVLVGDHKQLGPVVVDNHAQVQGLGRSMFERLVSLDLPRVRLAVQYRMHPSISAFPNSAFYQGTLRDGVTEADRWFTARFQPLDKKQVFFWHIPAEEEWDSRGRSQINRIEALRVEAVVKAMPTGTDIGVITFYDGQRSLLLRALGEEACEVASVDGFQGREKEVVILSTVRANTKGRIGFLDDFRRLNVAITRARRALVICGNARTIRASGDSTWTSFLLHLDENGAIFEGRDIYSLRKVSLASAH